MFSVIARGIDKYGAIGAGKVGLEGTTLAAAGHIHLLWNRANKKDGCLPQVVFIGRP